MFPIHSFSRELRKVAFGVNGLIPDTLRKTCARTLVSSDPCFLVFCKIRVRENPYSGTFYAIAAENYIINADLDLPLGHKVKLTLSCKTFDHFLTPCVKRSKAFNSFMTEVPYHTETSPLICRAN